MRRSTVWQLGAATALALVGAALGLSLPSVSAEEEKAAGGPKAFATPEALVEAWVAAVEKNDDAAMKALAGPDHADQIQPGGDPSVAKVRATFLAKAKEFWTLRDNEDGSKTLVVGDNRWPFPMPLRSSEAGWTLDFEAGREELRMRRIGWNELNAIKICRAFARAQEEYREKDRDGDEVREYAQRVRSTPGARDGLYWPTGDDGEESPFGPMVAELRPYLRDHQASDPVGGYRWKILLGQGPRAPGGHHSYLVNGNMIAGFALAGFPAEYGETGVMSFLVSHHGQVLEKDLGVCTAGAAQITTVYNPDDTWTAVED